MTEAAAPPDRRRRGFAVAAVALGLTVGLALAEGALRLVAPQPMGPSALVADAVLLDHLAPGLQGTVALPGLYTYRFSHDAEGRRTTVPAGPEGAPTVLLLGDSFTYGMGVDDGETLASQLAVRLASRGTPARVVNGGVMGKDPTYFVRLMATRGREWDADVVAYVFYCNDFTPATEYLRFAPDTGLVAVVPANPTQRLKRRLESLPGVAWLTGHSHLVALLRSVAVQTVGANTPDPSVVDLDTTITPPVRSSTAQAPVVEAALAALEADASARGAAFQMYYLPSGSEVAFTRRTGTPSADDARYDAVRRALGADGMSFAGPLAASGLPIARLYFPEIHWRPVALSLAADAMADPVQAALCTRRPSLGGCDAAPEAVRRVVRMRRGADPAAAGGRSVAPRGGPSSGAPSRRSPAG